MRYFVFILFASLIAGCGFSSKEDRVMLVPGLSFGLQGQEREGQKTREVLQAYQSLTEDIDAQLPLLKFVHHPDYQIYFGLPLGDDIQKMQASSFTFPGQQERELRDSSHIYTTIPRDTSFIVIQLYTTPPNEEGKSNSVFVLIDADDRSLAIPRFNIDSLTNRWNH